MVDLGHWEGVLEESTDLPYGFIYKITNLTNDKKYIGKKQCQSIRKRPPLKGKNVKNSVPDPYTQKSRAFDVFLGFFGVLRGFSGSRV